MAVMRLLSTYITDQRFWAYNQRCGPMSGAHIHYTLSNSSFASLMIKICSSFTHDSRQLLKERACQPVVVNGAIVSYSQMI